MEFDKNKWLGFKPMRLFDFWKLEGDTFNPSIIALGVSGKIFTLNAVASLVWLQLDGEHSIRNIIDTVFAQTKDVEQEIVEKDVLELIRRFDADDLIIVDYNPLYPIKVLNSISHLKT